MYNLYLYNTVQVLRQSTCGSGLLSYFPTAKMVISGEMRFIKQGHLGPKNPVGVYPPGAQKQVESITIKGTLFRLHLRENEGKPKCAPSNRGISCDCSLFQPILGGCVSVSLKNQCQTIPKADPSFTQQRF